MCLAPLLAPLWVLVRYPACPVSAAVAVDTEKMLTSDASVGLVECGGGGGGGRSVWVANHRPL